MMFQRGDTVIHPGYGAGTVIYIEEQQFLGSKKPYYSIELLHVSKTRVWVAVKDARKRGLRHPTPQSQLERIWDILRAEPETLPPDHDDRYESLQEKLRSGDIFQIAKAVRDMFWKDHRSHRLTVRGRQLYDRGLTFLASEVAVVQDCDYGTAEAMISDILGASLAAKPAI
jgi:CarD family transcriptional regulator